jgi:hypothetical protein
VATETAAVAAALPPQAERFQFAKTGGAIKRFEITSIISTRMPGPPASSRDSVIPMRRAGIFAARSARGALGECRTLVDAVNRCPHAGADQRPG